MHNNEGADDIFIPPHFVCGALHGDEVEVRLERASALQPVRGDTQTRQVGQVMQILKRGTLVGEFFTEGVQGYVRPTERKIPYIFTVPPKSRRRFGLADGHQVIFSVDKRARPENELTPCFITEVLGHINDPGMDVLTLVRQAGIPYEWADGVLEEAAEIPDELHEADIENRLDLRDWQICTIDGDDTKDIDDAISLTVTDAGHFRLGVHIADVTHYVVEGSALDREALRRGTSVYLADRVIPMLPHRLSNGICSLFPEVDRLAVSCIMTVDAAGEVLEYEIAPSVINSKRRWIYDEVEEIIDEDPLFTNLNKLREILYAKRCARGALDFDLPEAKIRVDENGFPISIEPYRRTRATGIIEECMILCNETIAAHCLTKKIPFVYRTHEPPNAEKLARLNSLTQAYGFTVPANAKKPMALQRVLTAVADTPAAYAVSGALLRCLPQAHYTPDDPTHYGLASEAYCHFTSPIRRYADLQAHRILKAFLVTRDDRTRYKSLLPAVCAHVSRTEREAETLERDVARLKKTQFMQGREGERFAGVVSGITAWGVYVMLPNTVEGLIPIEELRKMGIRYDKERGCFISRRGRTELAPGASVTVRLVEADADERKITFRMERGL